MRLKSGLGSILAGVGMAFLVGCQENIESSSVVPSPPTGIIPTATTNDSFAIVWPQSGESLTNGNGHVYIKGVGLNPNKLESFDVVVYTDRPWAQNYRYEISPNWSWQQKVDLGGTGRYNNHTIEATANYTDGTRNVSVVRGVVRADAFE